MVTQPVSNPLRYRDKIQSYEQSFSGRISTYLCKITSVMYPSNFFISYYFFGVKNWHEKNIIRIRSPILGKNAQKMKRGSVYLVRLIIPGSCSEHVRVHLHWVLSGPPTNLSNLLRDELTRPAGYRHFHLKYGGNRGYNIFL